MKPTKNTVLSYALPTVQILLGLTFLFSGFVKVIDPVGSFIKVEEYLIAFGIDLPRTLHYVLAIGQAMLECALGTCVLLGLWKKESARLLLIYMGVMTCFTLYLALTNPISDCGCFGDVIKLSNWETFGKNVLLLLLAFVLLRYKQQVTELYGKRTSRWSLYWSLIFSLLLSVYAYRHQPIFDFQPFKVGNNLRALTASTPDSVEYAFIYENDGVKKTYGMDNLPSAEEGWRYVDRTETVIKKGIQPVIENMSIIHPTQGEITHRILSDTSYVFLLISSNLDFANRSYMDEINRTYQYADQSRYTFYGLTASGKETIDDWQYEYDTEFDVCAADDKLLLSMMRSNPGLMLLKDGVVIKKWAFRDIPNFNRLDRPLNESRLGKLVSESDWRRLALLILVFAFPLIYFHQLHSGKLAGWTHKRITNKETV